MMSNNQEPQIDLSMLEGLSPEEKEVALNILKQFVKEGQSDILQEITYGDFEEIPVDIEEFLDSDYYLGKALWEVDPITGERKCTLWPYWREKLKDIFPDNLTTKYNTIILTGAIGLGKTQLAVIVMLYLLYRMLCLKDPYAYYGMTPIDKLTFSMLNCTIDAAKGVAWDKAQQMLQISPWFMDHGNLNMSRTNPQWQPPKGIEMIFGSNNNHVIGRALFCLEGNTEIVTTKGIYSLKNLVGKSINVISIDENGKQIISDSCTVQETIKTNEEIQIELEDGTTIKCTPNHRLMLKNGDYKEAQYLTEYDELAEIKKVGTITYLDYIRNIIKIKSIKKVILDSPKQYYDVIEANPYNNFLIKTNTGYIVSHNCNISDEVNFSAMGNNVEKHKQKLKRLIAQIDARMRSRFLRGTYLPTVNIIISSKDSEQAFLDGYIKGKRDNESKTSLIVEESQWTVDPRKGSPEDPGAFWVAVGNKFLTNELLPKDASEELVESYRAKGYSMIKVPPGYRETFEDNLDQALMDIVGLSGASATKFISGVKLNAIKVDDYLNPFTKDIIEVGNGPDDFLQYANFFDLSRVKPSDMSKPLFIHLDMSFSGDKTGIVGTWIEGKRPSIEGDDNSRTLFYKVAFATSVKAPRGHQISFEKTRIFINWLREQGFSIKSVSMDTFQSAQMYQELLSDGFNANKLSVDVITPTHAQDEKGRVIKQCIPYEYLKTAINERHIKLFKKCDLLTEELVNLEKSASGKVDHPTNGCFTGDTKVSLVDGRELTFLELVEEYKNNKVNYVYSFNEKTKKIEPKPIKKAWCTRKNAELVEVTLDSGEVIRCTPNHLFMLRDSSYCQASNLIPGVSLMPLYRRFPSKGNLSNYRQYYEPIEDKWHYEHRQFASEVLDEKYLVHHKDCNPANNSPTNLVWCSKKMHQQIHTEMQTGAQSEEANNKRKKSLSEYYLLNKDNPVFINRNLKISETLINKEKLLEKQNKIKALEDTFNIEWNKLSNQEKDKYAVKYQRLLHPETIDIITEKVKDNHKKGLYINADKALQKANLESKKLKELIPTVDPCEFKQIFGFDFETIQKNKRAPWVVKYRRIVGKKILNHKVVSIKILNIKEDVYDIEVVDNHNFALTCGIFVHNSKDAADSLAGSVYSASLFADQYALDYGETLDAVINVNVELNDEERKRNMIADFERELTAIYTEIDANDQKIRQDQRDEYNFYKDLMDGIIVI